MRWWRKKQPAEPLGHGADRIRTKYASFRKLLSLNDECLELLAALQEDLQFVPARRTVVEAYTQAVFMKAAEIVGVLERLAGQEYPALRDAMEDQQRALRRFLAGVELAAPRLAVRLYDVDRNAAQEVGGKAAMLGEVQNRLGVPVPEGYVLTTEAYRQFCGVPLWTQIRDELRRLDIHDHAALRAASSRLVALVMSCPLPRTVEVAIRERAALLGRQAPSLVVRSSALGEGASERTYAGQYLTLLNVPVDNAVEAYRRVVAARFSERALFYRLSTGLMEVDSPMAVLFLPMLPAKASGVTYTRDPSEPRRNALWIAATRGLGADLASGRAPADLFILSRRRRPRVLSAYSARKEEMLVPAEGGGLRRVPVPDDRATEPSMTTAELERVAQLGIRLEKHFRTPQDAEWVLDEHGKVWMVQTRGLALAKGVRGPLLGTVRSEPLLEGRHTIYPGRVSGPAFLAEHPQTVNQAPAGSILFVRRPAPEIVPVFPRIGGLVAEWGSPAGHAAALLREFKVPSIFLVAGAFERIEPGVPVSLDATRGKVYAGALFPPRALETSITERTRERSGDVVATRVLALHLLDPASLNFRPRGCKSVHDVLRFCHEKAVQAMFTGHELESAESSRQTKLLRSSLPTDHYVLDLGGGLRLERPEAKSITPAEIVSRPFHSLWKGFTHPGVSWTRGMPATLSDMASIMGRSLGPEGSGTRALAERSYLLVADEYLNMNSRLAFHFTLVDACLSDVPTQNYISFRFAGGGATRWRRNLRACFLEACLREYGFKVERRGDLVNAWLKKTSAFETDAKLDILGRLMASTCQLDMYMTSEVAMQWYVQQFLAGNYTFQPPDSKEPATPGGNGSV
ncbi:MAG: hypothetical protein FJW34_13125 [Acidobacteria bacterium]|nr:hypothetical protein [Acidobacteriota bacterium]